MFSSKLVLIFGISAMAGWAESSATVSGPVTGFIFDGQTASLRPMLGIPGAAYLGAPAVSKIDAAAVSPDGSAALAVQAGRLVLYTGLRNAAPAVVTIPGAIAADRFAWAADSGSAAVYSSKSGQAQILSKLAQTPAAGAAIGLTGMAGTVTALAFDGQRILFGVESATAGGIYSVDAHAAPQRIAPAASPSAIGLAGADLYFADKQSQQIWQVQSYAGTSAAVLFANDSSISSPAGVQLSADGQRLYVANAGSRKLAVYDIASRAPAQSIALTCTPTRLDHFGDSSVLLLNDTGQGPLYVLSDSHAAKPAVYFVPAPAPANWREKIRRRPI